MPEDDLDYELLTSPKQLPPPLPLRKKPVVLVELGKNASGRYPALLACELTQGDYNEFQQSTRVYENGYLQGVNLDNQDLKFLAFCLQDANGNRMWPTVEKAIEQLKMYGRAIISKLLAAANEVNDADPVSAEGNSEQTQSESSPSN